MYVFVVAFREYETLTQKKLLEGRHENTIN